MTTKPSDYTFDQVYRDTSIYVDKKTGKATASPGAANGFRTQTADSVSEMKEYIDDLYGLKD